ncbi:MAG: hypothetical protein JRN08_09990 [Nitrososphaerota archaeon]|nr:hypothetical protein [Nitrososphaerota archaeon]
MRFASLDHFDISALRMAAVGASASAAAALLAGVTLGGVLGQATPATLLVVAVLVFYIVLTTPRRILDGQRVAQARESVVLSAAAKACLNVTGSRSRTLLLLRPRDPTFAAAVADAGRMVLVGVRVDSAVAESSSILASYSAAVALRSVATLRSSSIDAGDEETRGLASSSDLSRETKLPMFMTVCFFSPIMLLLYAVFSHSYDPGSLVELAAFEFMMIDLAFYLTASDRGPR